MMGEIMIILIDIPASEMATIHFSSADNKAKWTGPATGYVQITDALAASPLFAKLPWKLRRVGVPPQKSAVYAYYKRVVERKK